MILKKDSIGLGLILGAFAPLLGLLFFKYYQMGALTLKEAIQYVIYQPGFKILSVALSLSLLLNALLFTIYINTNKDNTAKGIFITTLVYGLIVLSIKTFM
ncbi:MAG: hypothetical protein EOO06_19595 [Chitinophagaceae bacterium]|nr:MAG: hypothetical protein EOO06_19595 [Chitinophagaceae bacterium]